MCALCTEKSDSFITTMMESDTNIVSDEKLLLKTALNGAKDSVNETSSVKDVQGLENVTSSALYQSIDSEPIPPKNSIPGVELLESDASSYNDQFVNSCTTGKFTDDQAATADEGFTEEKVLPSERGDDIVETDQSSGIYSPSDMTPNSNEELCPITIVDVQSVADKIDSEETSHLHCSDTRSKSPIRNLCDTPLSEVLSPSRHSNVFELAFLQNLEKTDSSFSGDDTKRSFAAPPTSEVVVSVTGMEYLSERCHTNFSVDSPTSDESDFHSESVGRNRYWQPISITPLKLKSTVLEEDELNNTVKCSGVSVHRDLKDDAKLWCQAYVKLVDCANLLLLTIPSVITDTFSDGKSLGMQKAAIPSVITDTVSEGKSPRTLKAAIPSVITDTFSDGKSQRMLKAAIPSVITDTVSDGKFPRTQKAASLSPSKSISPSKHSKDLGAASLLEEIGKSLGSESNSLCEDTDSHSDRGRKKRQRRPRQAPETKARKTQSRSPRRIFVSRCKPSRKRSHDGDPDEVICKLDAWKKLHKSKAKANKQSSMNASTLLASHETSVKPEPLDESLSIPSECCFASASGDAGHAKIKTELPSDAAFVFAASQSEDQVPQLPLAELKTEVKDFSFAIVKQEPADDYLYTGNFDSSNVDTDGITPLFPIDDVVSLASVQIQVSGACYALSEILEDDYWQPSVVLKRFPIWILQNLQNAAEGLNVDNTPVITPKCEDFVDSWDSSYVTQGSLQVASESVPFNMTSGYNSESDLLTTKLNENAGPLLSMQVSLSNEDESSLKIDALPLETIVQPLTKRFKSGPASRVRGPKSKRVKEHDKKENEEESRKTLSESVCKLATEVDAGPEEAEMPKRLGRPRKSARLRLQKPEESEKPLDKENVLKTPEKEMSGDVLCAEKPVVMETVSKVPAGERKHRKNIPEAEIAEPLRTRGGRRKKETTISEKPVEKVPTVVDNKGLLKSKVDEKPTTVKENFRAGEEKKSKPKLGFVIPKKKPPDPNAPLPGATQQPKPIPNRASLPSSTFMRIPKLSKALSEEDKERSVLAKLDTEVGKREALKWNSTGSWTSKTPGTLNGSVTNNQGVGSQDKQQNEKWQRTAVDRFRVQNLNGSTAPPLGPQQQPRPPKVPLLGFAPGINAVGSEWNRCSDAVNRAWINNYGFCVGQPQNSAPGSFPAQPNHRMDEQWPIPTVGFNIPVIQSAERLTINSAEVGSAKRNCRGERGMGSLTDAALLDRSESVLREVPYVTDEPSEVLSSHDVDDDNHDDYKGTDKLRIGSPCREVLASSAAPMPQSFPLLEDLPVADNMDDSIRLFAEAVQEAIEQGDISTEKCERLVNLYEKLCRDLIADDVKENQQKAEAAGIICDTINQTMAKEVRSNEDLKKNRMFANSGFGAASDLLRSFGNADKFSLRGNSSVDYTRPSTSDQVQHGLNEDSMRHEKSALLGYNARKSSASGSYRHEHNANHASGSLSFDGCTNRSFAILQDDALWRDLLAQGQSPGMSEESLELLRRLLVEAAKRGVYDEQMVNMLNVVCQHIKLEDSKEQSLRKEFGNSSAFQHSVRGESVEIPFINDAQHFVENKGMLKNFHRQNEDAMQRASPISPLLSSRLHCESYEIQGLTDSESESGFNEVFPPSRVSEDKAAAEKREQIRSKQEAFAIKVVDEIRLLEMLVSIQCELAVVTCFGVPPVTTSGSSAEPGGKSAEPIQPTEPGKIADSNMPHISASEPSHLSADSSQTPVLLAAASFQSAAEKALGESCDTPNLASEPLLCHPSTSTAGDESQDSHSTQKSTKSAKEKDRVIDKKSCDPKAIEEKVISMARNALKPHYHNGAITSEEFKLIMKKAIAKICKSRSTDISQKRITKFMNAYVEKIIQSRK